MSLRPSRPATAATAAAILLAACSFSPSPSGSPRADASFSAEEGELVVYSGRTEELVGPIIERFSQETDIDVAVRYGDTAEMANLILTEGENSPADLYFAQDAGALGALASEGLLATLPDDVLGLVEERFRSPDGQWIGLSGRSRVVAYNTDNVDPADLPNTIFGFTDPDWSGRIGWAPTNGSFQSFVTALRVLEGEDRAREWLEGIQANDPKVYEGNNPALEAVIAGEIDVAFINHYYLMQRLAEDPDVPAANYFVPGGDPGALINVAGAGILNTADQADAAEQLVEFLLSEEAQTYFAEETKEYPLAAGVEPDPELPPLAEIATPDIDLSDLSDLEGTLELLQDLGIL
ncbi:MAG TPA: iron ABC transporter substrate-binding protein [Candidatus Limnocylindria bacterium]|nr:iron ABC transporter substrate-binding protein [Candidatus Limnocylindria bacterium]